MARRDFRGLERRRMRAVRLFEEGQTQATVAHRLKVSRTTAMRWAEAWERNGPEGLRALLEGVVAAPDALDPDAWLVLVGDPLPDALKAKLEEAGATVQIK